MSIRDYHRRDSVICTVLYKNSKGSVLKIKGVTENPYVILHDIYLARNSVVLVSIAYISPDFGYVKVTPDSLEYAEYTAA